HPGEVRDEQAVEWAHQTDVLVSPRYSVYV
ncbi:MAG: hypothetical protein QOF58_5535, partial [Pseudonocardiales bacterium]|nr:hypothetical protein [Pseudonocardiales bacterium]